MSEEIARAVIRIVASDLGFREDVRAKVDAAVPDRKSVRIDADTVEARQNVDGLRARLDELSTRVATARANVDDRDARAKVLAINAQLLRLGERVANPKIDLRGVAEAEAQLAALRREHDAASARLSQLATAPDAYARVLDDKEQHLRESGDPRRMRLLELADERGRLTGEMREIAEAMQAARTAFDALSQVQEKLGSASGWSTYDTFFGGGAISSAIKHSRLDEAAQAAAHADRCLAVLRTELADVQNVALTVPNPAVDGLTRFVDVWFDNIFTDLAVRDRIKQAERNVARSMELVREVHESLKQRRAQARARLATIDTERHGLLARE